MAGKYKLVVNPQDSQNTQVDNNGQTVPKPKIKFSGIPAGTRPTPAAYAGPTFMQSQLTEDYDVGRPYDIPEQEWKAERQSKLEKWGRAPFRMAVRFSTAISQTPAYLMAFGKAGLTDATLAEALDEGWIGRFLNSSEFLNEQTKEYFAIHAPESVRNGGLSDNLFSASFYTNEGADALGFFLGFLGPSAALRGFDLAGKAQRALKLGNTWARGLENTTAVTLNTVAESLAEANDFRRQLSAELDQAVLDGKISRTDADRQLAEKTSDVAMANLAILALPNALMQKTLFGRFLPTKQALTRILETSGEKTVLKPFTKLTKAQVAKEYASKIGLSYLREGIFEEGMQGTVQEINKKLALNNADLEGFSQFANEYASFLSSNEGQKAAYLGGLLGGGASALGTYQNMKETSKGLQATYDLLKESYDGFAVNTSDLIDSNGQLKPDRVQEVLTNLYYEIKADEAANLAAGMGFKEVYDYINTGSVLRALRPMIEVDGTEKLVDSVIEESAKKYREGLEKMGIYGEEDLAMLNEEDENYRKELKDEVEFMRKTSKAVKGKLSFASSYLEGGTEEQLEKFLNRLSTALYSAGHTEYSLEKERKKRLATIQDLENRLANPEVYQLSQVEIERDTAAKKAAETQLEQIIAQQKSNKEHLDILNEVQFTPDGSILGELSYVLEGFTKQDEIARQIEPIQKLYNKFLKDQPAEERRAADMQNVATSVVDEEFKTGRPVYDESGLSFSTAFGKYAANNPNITKEEFLQKVMDVVDKNLELAESQSDPDGYFEIALTKLRDELGFGTQAAKIEAFLRLQFGLAPLERAPETSATASTTSNAPPQTGTPDPADILSEEDFDPDVIAEAMADQGQGTPLENLAGEQSVATPTQQTTAQPVTQEPPKPTPPKTFVSKDKYNGVAGFQVYSSKLSTGATKPQEFFWRNPAIHALNPTGYTFIISTTKPKETLTELPSWNVKDKSKIGKRKNELATIELRHKDVPNQVVGYIPDPDIYLHPVTGEIVDISKLSEQEYYTLFPADRNNPHQEYNAVKAAYITAKQLYTTLLGYSSGDTHELPKGTTVTVGSIGGWNTITPAQSLTKLDTLPNKGKAMIGDTKDTHVFVLADSKREYELDGESNAVRSKKDFPRVVRPTESLWKNSLELRDDITEALNKLDELQDKFTSRHHLLVPNAVGSVIINGKPHSWIPVYPNQVVNREEITNGFAEYLEKYKAIPEDHPNKKDLQKNLSMDFKEWEGNTFFVAMDTQYYSRIRFAFGKFTFLFTTKEEIIRTNGKPTFHKIEITDISSLDKIADQITAGLAALNLPDGHGKINANSFKYHLSDKAIAALKPEDVQAQINKNFGTLLSPYMLTPLVSISLPRGAGTSVVTRNEPQGVVTSEVSDKKTEDNPIPSVTVMPSTESIIDATTASDLEFREASGESLSAEDKKKLEAFRAHIQKPSRDFDKEYEALTPEQKDKFKEQRAKQPSSIPNLQILDEIIKCQ